jgi:outer membrane protein OmpA-like peptidoglycan-associated protein
MKKYPVLIMAGAMLSCTAFAQLQDRYTISGGVLGAANYSKFRVSNSTGTDDLTFKWGYAAGVFINFPLGNVVSLEAQAQYSRVGSKNEPANVTTLDQELTYLSVPVFAKIHAGRFFAITLGGQADFLLTATDKTLPVEVKNKDDFKSTSIGVTGGLEFFPRDRVTIYGRYMHGLTKIGADNSTAPYFYNQQIQAGLKFKLFGHRVAAIPPPPPPPVVVDSDGDGINDTDDRCPAEAGTAQYNGCPVPDTDGDGIKDDVDKCPNEAGTAQYNGCPVPDTDGDGIKDDMDKCPNEAGTAQFNGCPNPDKDGDGVLDADDKCPALAGVKENKGCPAIPGFRASNVQFVTGSSTLLPGALKELNEIVAYMKQYPEMKLQIDGHTDNVGKPEANQVLSEKRAASVVAALTKKGVSADRLTSAGHGLDSPIADNTTADGRAKNRRVEFSFAQGQ